MAVGELVRVASAMRTALVGHPMVGFDAPPLVGPTPRLGSVIELVEVHGKHVEVVWDDGLVLDTQLRAKSEWHVYRQGAPWRRSWGHLAASIQTEDFVAACFAAASVETYRQPDPSRHPFGGRLGPDLSTALDDVSIRTERAVELLLGYPDPEARVRDVLADQHVMRGVGNVYRCEVLWGCELSPWAHVGDLTRDDAFGLVTVAERLLRANRTLVRPLPVDPARTPETGMAVYGRTGQSCFRCRDSIASLAVGHSGRVMYWCPGCQVRLDRRPQEAPVLPMDPHPAAAMFLEEIRRQRQQR